MVVEGRIVALTYAYSLGIVASSEAFEFWWAPVDDPDSGDVLFGIGSFARGEDSHGAQGLAVGVEKGAGHEKLATGVKRL
jgi:hypothetical protein